MLTTEKKMKLREAKRPPEATQHPGQGWEANPQAQRLTILPFTPGAVTQAGW